MGVWFLFYILFVVVLEKLEFNGDVCLKVEKVGDVKVFKMYKFFILLLLFI